MDVELIREAFSYTKAGWYRLLATLGLINLSLLIDLLTGANFMSNEWAIKLFGLEIPKVAFSFIYTLLFSAFTLWALISTKVISDIIHSHPKDISKFPEYRLWILSPVSPSKGIRILFWLLVSDGLVILAVVAVIHLIGFLEPSPEEMELQIYVGIGWFCILMFVVTFIATVFYVYPKWQCIYKQIKKNC